MKEFVNKEDTALNNPLNASATSLKTNLQDDTYNEFLDGMLMGGVDKYQNISELNDETA